jgi:quercetin dioxygenase-like cupin family protein
MADSVFDITTHPIHLGLGAKALREPEFTGAMEWYQAYVDRHRSDGVEGRLVTIHSFSEPWTMWEQHPNGDEVVVCLAGRITLHQEIDGQVRTVTLEPYQAIVNPPGAWHTADVDAEATALFITAGVGTTHRPR